MKNHKLYTVVDTAHLSIDVMRVPGGMLVITETITENGNGIATGLATTFVQVTHSEFNDFVEGERDA